MDVQDTLDAKIREMLGGGGPPANKRPAAEPEESDSEPSSLAELAGGGSGAEAEAPGEGSDESDGSGDEPWRPTWPRD